MKSWYLIHSKPRQEELAKKNLERQGYSTYLPMARLRKRKAGRTVSAITAMFPRYLFIHLSDETDDWRPIRSTLGVANLVRFGQIPAKVPDPLITALQQREDDDGIQALPPKNYKAGQRVRIAEGPFEGYEGIFKATTGSDRVVLLLKVIESYVKVELDKNQIELTT